MIGRLICWWTKKHRRGWLIEIDEANKTRRFECPRCGTRWTRKAKAKKEAGK